MLLDPGHHHSSQPDGLIEIHAIVLTPVCVFPSPVHFLSMKMPSLCLDMPLVLMKKKKKKRKQSSPIGIPTVGRLP